MNMQRILSTIALATCLCAPAGAALINVNLTSPALAGLPGSKLTFSGTLSNNSGIDQFINGALLALNGFNANTLDSSPFLFSAPLVLANGTSTTPFTFFTVTTRMPSQQALTPALSRSGPPTSPSR